MGKVAHFGCSPDLTLVSSGAIPHVIQAKTRAVIIPSPVLPWSLPMYLAPVCALAQLLADLQNQGKGFVYFLPLSVLFSALLPPYSLCFPSLLLVNSKC